MAAYRVFIPLCLALLLSQLTRAKNEAPCLLSKRNNGYKEFLSRHVPPTTPSSMDQNEWEQYIRNMRSCHRPTQSFLVPEDLDRVRSVCTNKGGKVYKENLCISQQPFDFVTVRLKEGTCGVRRITRESKHLILACELLDNQCVPVHFEGNPTDMKPDNNARGCQDPDTRSHAASFSATTLSLLLAFLTVLWSF